MKVEPAPVTVNPALLPLPMSKKLENVAVPPPWTISAEPLLSAALPLCVSVPPLIVSD